MKLGGNLPPTMLHIIQKKGSSRDFLPVQQLRQNITKPFGVGKTSFYKKLDSMGDHCKKEATTTLVATLKKIGAITNMAPKCDLMSMATAVKLLRQLGINGSVATSMMTKVLATDDLSSSESSDTGDSSDTSDSGESSDCEDDNDENDDSHDSSDSDDSRTPPQPKVTPDPVVVTPQDVATQDTAGRYGLTSIKNFNEKKACLANISLEMTNFQEWSQAVYQAGRPVDFKQQGTKTWESQQKRVYEYLGYLYHHQANKRPSLECYLDTENFLAFLDFLKARGVDKAGHTKAVHAAIRVVSFVRGWPVIDQKTAKSALKMLKDLGNQLGQNMVPLPKSREPEDLKDEGRWMDAPQLMLKVEEVRQAALSEVEGMRAGSISRLQASKSVHNALLATMCFGYMPPLRHNSVLMTITAPPHFGCVHSDCQHKQAGCLGNRIFRHPTTGKWWLDVPHHKNSKAWNGTAIKFQLPVEVAELMEHHLTWAHRSLTGHLDVVAPTIFVNTTTGLPMKDQEVSKVWSKTVLDGTGLHFGPQMCRSIFVSGARDMGASNSDGMAMIMGNGQEVWDRIYDRHFNTREAHAALAQMPGLRQQMLEQAKTQVPPVAVVTQATPVTPAPQVPTYILE